MIITLKFIVSYDILGLAKKFSRVVFWHTFLKACQYALVDKKICKGLKYVFIKIVQFDLHKCII
jgi:hypothetical protein